MKTWAVWVELLGSFIRTVTGAASPTASAGPASQLGSESCSLHHGQVHLGKGGRDCAISPRCCPVLLKTVKVIRTGGSKEPSQPRGA